MSTADTYKNNLSARTYRHLFFDLDHTLWDFDTNSRITMQQVFHKHGLEQLLHTPFDPFYNSYIHHNNQLWHKYHHGLIKQDELRWKRMYLAMLDFKFAHEPTAQMLAADYLQHLPLQPALFPYTHQILRYLQQKGYLLHLITNGFTEVQQQKIERSKLQSYFTCIITSEEAMALKPHPEIFEFAMQRAGAQLHESIMLGDNPDADILGAINTGMDSVHVNHLRQVIPHQATYTVYHLQELENIF